LRIHVGEKVGHISILDAEVVGRVERRSKACFDARRE
jgi:hypothetical protein